MTRKEFLIVGYIRWHYGNLRTIHTNWQNGTIFLYNYFSIPLLARTLFWPFKRVYRHKTGSGFSPGDLLDRFSWNVVSRIMGAIVRTGTILTGFLTISAFGIVALLGGFLWALVVGFTFPIYFFVYCRKTVLDFFKSKQTLRDILTVFFHQSYGQFLTSRLGMNPQDLLNLAPQGTIVPLPKIQSTQELPDLFEAILKANSEISAYFDKRGISPSDISFIASWWKRLEEDRIQAGKFWDLDTLLHIPSIGTDWAYGYTPILDAFTVDLSILPMPYGRFTGRKKEIAQLEHVLSTRQQKSTVLLGEAGVGKEPLLIFFAHQVARGTVLPALEGKHIRRLDMERIFSTETDGTQRKRTLTMVLDEAAHAGNVVLVIDEFDRFVSSGADRIDLSDVFIHAFSRRNLQIIAVLVPGVFYRYIQPHSLLMKYFDIVEVKSLTKQEVMVIVANALPVFERGGAYYLYQTLVEIVEDADRYIKDIPYPEKAITILDDLTTNVPRGLKTTTIITPEDVKNVISVRIKAPVSLLSGEKQKLLNLETYFHERIVGQEEAVKAVSETLRRARADISLRKDKPIGSFLFLGPTGVGKTETAKTLAHVYFGTESSMVRFDMSEFQGSDAVKQFLGDFASGKVGVFAQKLRETPYTVVLLDEIEKANRELLNIFLAALDEGWMTDAGGKRVYLTNSIIVATSNAGAEFIRQTLSAGPVENVNVLKEGVLRYVQEQGIFSPEFLNRFDAVVVYHPLTQTNAMALLDRTIERIGKNLAERYGITLTVTQETLRRIVADGFDPVYGARKLQRAIAQHIETPLAEKKLRDELVRGSKIII